MDLGLPEALVGRDRLSATRSCPAGAQTRCECQAEVATDYNAGFMGAIAALKHLSITKQLPPITR
jgi:hypothetical protein